MENQSDAAMILNSRDKASVAVEGGLMLLMNFAALAGNLLMCLVMFKKPHFHTTSNTFNMSLSMCYMFASCLVMPFTAGALMAGKWPFGQVTCDIQGFVFLAFTWVSLLILTILAASRYFKVAHFPFYNKWFSLNRSIGMVLIIWVLVVLVLIVPLTFGSATFQFSPETSICSIPLNKDNQTENITNAAITLALYTALPIIAILTWYAIKRHEIYIRTSLEFDRGQRRTDDLKAIAGERKQNQILLVLIIEVLLLWLPAIIIMLLKLPTQSISPPRRVQLASTFLWLAIPVLHPITYGLLYRTFAKEVMKVLPRASLRQNKVHAEEAI